MTCPNCSSTNIHPDSVDNNKHEICWMDCFDCHHHWEE